MLHPIPHFDIKFPQIKIISKEYSHQPGDWTTYFKVTLDWTPVNKACLEKNCKFPILILERHCKEMGFEFDLELVTDFIHSRLDLDNLYSPVTYKNYYKKTLLVPKVYLDKITRYQEICEKEILDLNQFGALDEHMNLSCDGLDKSPNILRNCVDMFFWLLTRHQFSNIDGIKESEIIRTLYLYRFWKWQLFETSTDSHFQFEKVLDKLVLLHSNFENTRVKDEVTLRLKPQLVENFTGCRVRELHELVDSNSIFAIYESWIRDRKISEILD
jgi:hypothetical protein